MNSQSRASQIGQALVRFLRRTRAATVAEHAVVLALLSGFGLVVFSSLGSNTDLVFEEVAQTLGGRPTVMAARASGTGTTDAQPPDHAEGSGLAAKFGFVWIGICGVVVAVAGATVGAILNRRRREHEKVTPMLLPEATELQFVAKRQEILRALSNDLESLMTNHVRVKHLMTTRLTTVMSTTPVNEMQATMAAHQLRHLLVVDDDGRLMGVISDRDLHRRRNKKAFQIMSRKCLTCEADTPLSHAVTMLLESRISSLPVVRDNRLVGIVTATDVVMGLQCSLQLIERITCSLSHDPQIAAALIKTAAFHNEHPEHESAVTTSA